MYDKNLKKALSRCKSFPDMFEVISLPEHSSFLDYDIVKLLIDGSIESIAISYKKKLQKFFEE